MLEHAPGRIVVGIGPNEGHDAALEYAAVEARRRGCGIDLVLVIHPRWPGPDRMIEIELLGEELVRADAALLSRCEDRLGEWTGGEVEVRTEVLQGTPAASLVGVARHAELVVLQHHRMSRPMHLPTLSVTNGVASRAAVPVVAVPDGWHEAETSGRPVLAAVENAELSWGVARFAFEEARRGGGGVRLTRAWSYMDDLDHEDPLLRTLSTRAWTDHLRDRVSQQFAGMMAANPDVPSEVVVEHGQATYVLVTASEQARLVVIGRHRPALRVGSHLGPVTRAVLGHAHCPVLVVDPRRTAEEDAAGHAAEDTAQALPAS